MRFISKLKDTIEGLDWAAQLGYAKMIKKTVCGKQRSSHKGLHANDISCLIKAWDTYADRED